MDVKIDGNLEVTGDIFANRIQPQEQKEAAYTIGNAGCWTIGGITFNPPMSELEEKVSELSSLAKKYCISFEQVLLAQSVVESQKRFDFEKVQAYYKQWYPKDPFTVMNLNKSDPQLRKDFGLEPREKSE